MNTVEMPATMLWRELYTEGRHELIADDRVTGALLSENAVRLNEEWDRNYQGAMPLWEVRWLREQAALQYLTELFEDAQLELEAQWWRLNDEQLAAGYATHLPYKSGREP